MDLEHRIKQEGCACGKRHECEVREVFVGKGAIKRLPEALAMLGAKKVFLLADPNTYEAAGRQTEEILRDAGIPYSKYVYNVAELEPDEWAVGSAVMHFDRSCDTVLAVGSGVIGDIAKVLAVTAKAEYMIVGTAPSMDGYASSSSSMVMGGLKISLASRCPSVIIGDTDILKNAPDEMLKSGLGDMLAKYISLAEWRIAHLLVGEYYCEDIAELMRSCLRACTENAEGLLRREDEAVEAVFRGLVLAGMAMSYANNSRPASGVEHYFSHLWDMRALEFGDPFSTHGIQCAIGTLTAAKLYEDLAKVTPDREKGLAYVKSFDKQAWFEKLSAFLGKGADVMIALEEKERKYCPEKHAARIERIVEHWDEILNIVKDEIPPARELEDLLDRIECPKRPSDIGLDERQLPTALMATKDIRDKYILSRLLWDLGILEETAATL